jgi:hypothetical protein
MTASASPKRPDWAPTACERLRAGMLLGVWYSSQYLEGVGGRRFPARLHEIARGTDGKSPLAYDCRPLEGADGVFQYRLRVYGPGESAPEPKRKKARARIEELARENAELKRRLSALEGGAAHV